MTYEEFKRRYPIRLDPQQEAAVRRTEGPVLLLAVPGSGKTTTLISRLGYMICCKGIPPERILTVTYTVAATRDMKTRFVSLFGGAGADRLTFRTINGLCAVVVQYYARQKGTRPFALLDDERQLNHVVRGLLTQSGTAFPSDMQIRDVRSQITYCKNMMLPEPEIRALEVEGMDFPKVYFGYQNYLLRSRQMDFDDQMVFTYRIFRQYPDILDHFRRRWPYLCVDEAQDTSRIQHEILRLLARDGGSIFMVGDEDQSIYSFRAAWPQALLEFEQVFPGAEVLMLETNYRSNGVIVDRADAFIRRNRSRRPKHMRASNPPGPPIQKTVLSDYRDQPAYLLEAARTHTGSLAVLYRNNDSALPLVDLLERNGIAYACRQRESFFFSSPLVRDITDMLEFAFDDGNGELFLSFYYKLDLKMKKALVTELLYGMRPDQSVFDALLESGRLEPWQTYKVKDMQSCYRGMPALTSLAAIDRLVHDMGYGDYLEDQSGSYSRLDVLRTLADQTPDLGKFLLRLQELRACIERRTYDPDCPLVLSTIHSSKGLEYDHVILIDAVDGLLPSVEEAAGGQAYVEEEQSILEEERRLFYVAATRARRRLEFLCYENKFGVPASVTFSFISQFLGEAPRQQPDSVRPALPLAPSPAQIEIWMKDYIPGTEIVHKVFGQGTIRGRKGSFAVIVFQKAGEKTIDLSLCLRTGKIELVCYF